MGQQPWARVACVVCTGRFGDPGCVNLEAYFWQSGDCWQIYCPAIEEAAVGLCIGTIVSCSGGWACTTNARRLGFLNFSNGTWQLREKQLEPPQLFS